MRWISDATGAQWLAERLDFDNATMHGVVPRGFEAYARVFHPAYVGEEPVTWAHTAEAFGTTLHPVAQWNRIVRTPPEGDWHTRQAPDGREFDSPATGSLSPDDLSTLATHLVAQTTTPDKGVAAVWEGFGGLVGHMGHSPSRGFLTFTDDPNHEAMLNRSIRDPFNDVFRKPTWQEGILSREISEGPRLELPGRNYITFSAAPRAFVDPAWILDAPWRDLPGEAHGFAPSAQHPNIILPADRAWVMVSEIDFDSTIVAGSAELVRAICNDPMLEASPLTEGARLTWDADEVNE